MRAFVSMACTVAVIGFSDAASAQGKGGPKVKTPSGATARHGGGAHGKSVTYKPSAPKVTTTKTTTKAMTAKAPKTTTTHGGGHAKSTDVRTTPRTGNTATTTPTATNATTLTPVQQKLQKNTNLASKLQSRLPAGTDLHTAAAGFRNLGQFVAAVNVSNNLGLDFPALKTAMVTDGKSLGQAIQAQKGSSVNATVEAQHAERDASTMIGSTERKDKPGNGRKRQ